MAGSSTPPDGPRRRAGLTRDAILREALALIDERGIDGVSMRLLGARLGVEAMALYRHVAGKQGLLDGVADTLLAELASGRPGPGVGWRGALTDFARRYRRLVKAHPEAVPLLSGRPERMYVAARDAAEELLSCLVASGFARDDAIRAVRAVGRGVVVFSTDAQPAPSPGPEGAGGTPALPEGGYPLLRALLADIDRPDRGGEDLFEFALAALLDGLERRLVDRPR